MNPYVNIWLNPRVTIQGVLEQKTKFIPILPLSATSVAVAWGIFTYTADSAMVLVLLFLAAITAYAVMAYLLPELVTKFGKVWNGMGSFTKIQHVFALSSIALLPVFMLQLGTFVFPALKAAVGVTVTIHVIAVLLCVRNLIVGIAIAQGFTYGKSVINLIASLLPLLLARLVLIGG